PAPGGTGEASPQQPKDGFREAVPGGTSAKRGQETRSATASAMQALYAAGDNRSDMDPALKRAVEFLKRLQDGRADQAQASELQNCILRADSHRKQGRPNEAVEAYQKALEAHARAVRKEDEDFVRRAYLDLLGTNPAPEIVQGFLADKNPRKRAVLLDRLLT